MSDDQNSILILVHQDREQLIGLLDRISGPARHACIHIDRKSDRRPFLEALKVRDDCTILDTERSFGIHWCGFGMPLATLSLRRAALGSDALFEQFQLLSGADTPIKTTAAMDEVLADDGELMRVDRMLDPDGDRQFDQCANRRFLGNVGPLNPRSRPRRFSGQG